MIRNLDLSGIDGINLVPGAVIARSVRYFRDQGLAFLVDVDDLDRYELAPFFLEGAGALALMRYQGAPEQETTLLIPAEIEGDMPRFTQLLMNLAKAANLPVSAFHWRSGGEQASLQAAD